MGRFRLAFAGSVAVALTAAVAAAANVAVTTLSTDPYNPQRTCNRGACQLDVGFIASHTGGATWGTVTQCAGPMSPLWLPNTSQGRMVGDYISTSYSGGLAHGLFEVATLPTGNSSRDCATASPNCHQALSTNATGLSAPEGGEVASTDRPVVAPGSYPVRPSTPLTAR